MKISTLPESKRNQIIILEDELLFAQDIIETIREAFVVLDSNLRIVAANPSFYSFFHVKEKDTEGKLLYDLGNGQWDIIELRILLEKIIPTHSVFNDYEVDHEFPQIGRKIMFLNARRIDSKKLILLAFDDVTGRRKIETQNQDFIAVASHELKTPVTSAKAYTQVLLSRFKKAGDSASAELLNKMDGQLDKLTALIHDLLDTTKIQGGQLQFHVDTFDFDTWIAEVVEDVQRTTTRHTLLIKGTTKKKITADKERVGQVLTNLLTNSIKYSPHADKIIISLSSSNNTVTVDVEDFGIGIAKDRQHKVFERFYRESGPKETTFPGLGLGLFIAKEIVVRQGGEMWVKSVEGKGSIFSFTIPIKTKIRMPKNKHIEEEI